MSYFKEDTPIDVFFVNFAKLIWLRISSSKFSSLYFLKKTLENGKN